MSASDVVADKLKVWGHEDGLSMADGLLRTLTAAAIRSLKGDRDAQ